MSQAQVGKEADEMKIWVDADACPVVIKEILFKAADRTRVPLTLVANQPIRVPASRHITTLQVASGFDVADNEIVKRLSGRRVHPGSGRVYHVEFNPPVQAGIDDESGEELVQREDDQEETIRKRLQVYHEQTEPLVGFYTAAASSGASVSVVKVNGLAPVDEIRSQIDGLLSS